MTKQPPKVTLVGVSRLDNGMYLVVDAEKRMHYASDDKALGATIAMLVDDPDLPDSKIDAEQNESVGLAVGIMRKFAKKLAPELAPLVESIEPGAHAIANYVEKTRGTRRRRGSKTRVSRG